MIWNCKDPLYSTADPRDSASYKEHSKDMPDPHGQLSWERAIGVNIIAVQKQYQHFHEKNTCSHEIQMSIDEKTKQSSGESASTAQNKTLGDTALFDWSRDLNRSNTRSRTNQIALLLHDHGGLGDPDSSIDGVPSARIRRNRTPNGQQ